MIGVDFASVDDNKSLDFVKARAAGARFAIVRGAYDYAGHACVDPTVKRTRDAIRAAGLQFGAYLIVGYPSAHGYIPSPPEAQAAAFIAAYGDPQPGDLPIGFDVEFPRGREATGLTAVQAFAWLKRAADPLIAKYGSLLPYTSAQVWSDDLASMTCPWLGCFPLWLKTPYSYRAQQPPHLTDPRIGKLGELPAPWHNGGPGVWLQQFQGDALGFAGFSATVDLNMFIPYASGRALGDDRGAWVRAQLAKHVPGYSGAFDGEGDALRAFQRAQGLVDDGVIGPMTFAALAR